MNTQDLELVCHGLGLDERHEEPWRNHYVAGEGHPDWEALLRLEAAGLLERVRTPGFLPVDDVVFAATVTGRQAALDHREGQRRRAPKLTRSQARYRRFLEADGAMGGTFREFLRNLTLEARRERGVAQDAGDVEIPTRRERAGGSEPPAVTKRAGTIETPGEQKHAAGGRRGA